MNAFGDLGRGAEAAVVAKYIAETIMPITITYRAYLYLESFMANSPSESVSQVESVFLVDLATESGLEEEEPAEWVLTAYETKNDQGQLD